MQEGVEFLKSQGADHLVPEDPDKPQVQRDSTIQATVKVVNNKQIYLDSLSYSIVTCKTQ